MRVLGGGDHARGHRVGVERERGVHAGDHPVELAEQLVGVVQRPVGKHVDLATGEQVDALEPGVGLAHELDLAAQLVGRDVVAEAMRRRVVGDREVLVAAFAGGLAHLGDRRPAVGSLGVAVQVAADVAQLHQRRERAGDRRLDLTAVLAQLRLDVGEAQTRVELLLARAQRRLAGGVVEHSVLGDVQSPPHRPLAQRRIVGGRAGQVLEQVAELLGGHGAQLDDEPVVGARPCGAGARARRRLDQLELADAVQQLGAVEHEVEILDALRTAARGARQLDVSVRVELVQGVEQKLADRQRAVEDRAPHAPLRRRRGVERDDDRLLEACPEALQRPQPLRGGRLAERLRGVDPELVEQAPRALGAQSGQRGDRKQAGGETRPQLDRGRDVAGLDQVADLLLERGADPG